MDDYKIEILAVGERIQLLKKRLSEAVEKKAELMEEVKQLERLVEEIELELYQESEREKLLMNAMIADQVAGPETDDKTSVIGHLDLPDNNKETTNASEFDLNMSSCSSPAAEGMSINIIDIVDPSDISSSLQNFSTNDSTVLEKSSSQTPVIFQPSSSSYATSSSSSMKETTATSNVALTSKKLRPLLPKLDACSYEETSIVPQTYEMTIIDDRRDIIIKGTLACGICYKEYKRYSHLRAHMVTHTTESETPNEFNCAQCTAKFTSSSRLKQHESQLHTVPNQPAPDDDQTQQDDSEVLSSFFCRLCNRDYVTAYRYRKHMVTHSEERPYSCDICNKSFSLRHSLTVHRKIHMVSDEPNQLCNVCGKSFLNVAGLRQHMMLHGFKKYGCDICEKRFSYLKDYMSHRLVHTGECPFVCSVCGKGVRSAKALNLHMVTHSDVKIYACVVCDKRFHFASYLRTHMRTHTGEKVFACPLCDEKFANQYNVKVHCATTHADVVEQRTYACTLCDKTFVVLSSLKAHMISHCPDAPYKCDDCGKQYKHVLDLRKHCFKVHGIGDAATVTGTRQLRQHQKL